MAPKIEGKTVSLLMEQEGKEKTISVNLGTIKSGRVLGAMFETKAMPPMPIITALKKSVSVTSTVFVKIIGIFKSLFSKKNMGNFVGPIRVFAEAAKSAAKGFDVLLFLLAMISLHLAAFNILPIPIFDGGQALIYTIEAIIGRPLPIKAREYIAIGCWILIIGLYLILSVKDILHFFG